MQQGSECGWKSSKESTTQLTFSRLEQGPKQEGLRRKRVKLVHLCTAVQDCLSYYCCCRDPTTKSCKDEMELVNIVKTGIEGGEAEKEGKLCLHVGNCAGPSLQCACDTIRKKNRTETDAHFFLYAAYTFI